MASAPRKWRSDLPPRFSELIDKLIKEANSFIRWFDTKESRMREIVGELRRICKEVQRMQEVTDKVRTAGARGAAGGGAAVGLGILAAPFTGGLSLLAAVGGVFSAAGGGVAVAGSNIKKMWSESGSTKKVEKLGEELKEIVEPLKRILEEIKETCVKLEEKAAEVQSGYTLLNMEEYEENLRRVSELKVQSSGTISASESCLESLENLLVFIVNVFGLTKVTAAPEEDRKLRDAITESACQSQDVTDEFKKTQALLKEILNDW